MEASAANPYLSAVSHPALLIAFLFAEAVVFRIAYRPFPIVRVGGWAFLSTASLLAVAFVLRGDAGPASLPTSFLAGAAAAWAVVALANRLRPPPSLLRVVLLANAAVYAVNLIAVRRAFVRG
jgi:hypothetical protein